MIDKTDIEKEVLKSLEGSDKFVVDISVKAGNRITVLLDSDSHISIDDCVAVTRHIESVFDREADDYDLTVSSAGIDQPLKLQRQFIKNYGREVNVTLNDTTQIKGKLTAADNEKITVYRKTKVKKVETEETIDIPLSEIKHTKVVISFK